MMLGHYPTDILISLSVFAISLWMLFIFRTNIILMVFSLELLLLSNILGFTITSVYLDDVVGEVFSVFILAIAAIETAIALCIILSYYRTTNKNIEVNARFEKFLYAATYVLVSKPYAGAAIVPSKRPIREIIIPFPLNYKFSLGVPEEFFQFPMYQSMFFFLFMIIVFITTFRKSSKACSPCAIITSVYQVRDDHELRKWAKERWYTSLYDFMMVQWHPEYDDAYKRRDAALRRDQRIRGAIYCLFALEWVPSINERKYQERYNRFVKYNYIVRTRERRVWTWSHMEMYVYMRYIAPYTTVGKRVLERIDVETKSIEKATAYAKEKKQYEELIADLRITLDVKNTLLRMHLNTSEQL
jgi:NADH-quinone oxidoreductase subunit K